MSSSSGTNVNLSSIDTSGFSWAHICRQANGEKVRHSNERLADGY